jgi:hypothetical protein
VTLPEVARGLFGAEYDFVVFPTHALMGVAKKKRNGKTKRHTITFRTSLGVDMYKLQLCDELIRRIASYGSETVPPGASRRESVLSITGIRSALQSPQESSASILGELPGRIDPITVPMSALSSQSSRRESMRSLQSYAGRDLISLRSLVHAQQTSMASAGTHPTTIEEGDLRRAILELASKGPGCAHGFI